MLKNTKTTLHSDLTTTINIIVLAATTTTQTIYSCQEVILSRSLNQSQKHLLLDSSYSGSETSQDDNSVGGLHSDYNTLLKDYNTLHHENSTKNECNLLCPGDMIEYYRVNDRSYIRRESITELCDSKISQYRKIQLKDGQTLYAGTHVLLRKIQSYCPDTKQLIPNPLGEWQTMEECMIQPGTIVDGNIVIDADVETRQCDGVTQFTRVIPLFENFLHLYFFFSSI